jgi:hypothetical protein
MASFLHELIQHVNSELHASQTLHLNGFFSEIIPSTYLVRNVVFYKNLKKEIITISYDFGITCTFYVHPRSPPSRA